jgi:hypothetical protein
VIWLRLPGNWPPHVVAVVALILLSILDLAGTAAAKEAADRRSAPIAAAGAVLFVAMFWVFASTLRVSSLVAVTFGWCVLVQVGVVILDRFRYGAHLTLGTYIAVAVLLVAQAYLLFASPSSATSSADPGPTAPGGDIAAQRNPQHAAKRQALALAPDSRSRGRGEPRHPLRKKNPSSRHHRHENPTRPVATHGRRVWRP